MNVLSLFDGMSCGQLALVKAGIPYETYYASEIDKHAIKVTQHNFPNTVQLGDITKVQGSSLPKIDLLIGGSPCQGFSFAGKGPNFNDPRSKLFFEYVRLLKETNPRWFLLENVCMKKEHEKVISQLLGVEPVMINSRLVSAQNRKRLYWTNIPNITQPADLGVTWGAIREHNVTEDHYYYSAAALAWLGKVAQQKKKPMVVWPSNGKIPTVVANYSRKQSKQTLFGVDDIKGLRFITPLECERAQTVPDGYTGCVSKTQRYRMLGNGWTVDVIAHILRSCYNSHLSCSST